MELSTYKNYEGECSMCGDVHPTRSMNKVYFAKSHNSCPTPRKLCCVCDICFPELLDYLEVLEPEEPPKRPYRPRQWCRKCVRDVGKNARFCPYCGDDLWSQSEVQV